MDSLAPSERHCYTHENRTIYEWDQTLSEVNIYIEVPPGVRAKQLFVEVKQSHIKIGIKPNPPYLDKDLAERIKADESFWTLEDGTLRLQLCKSEKMVHCGISREHPTKAAHELQGKPWRSALAGHDINPADEEKERQRLLLERFQEEHPGFDFSGATFNGEAPEANAFMGGMRTHSERLVWAAAVRRRKKGLPDGFARGRRSAAASTAAATAEQSRLAIDEGSRLGGRKVKVIGLGPRGYSAVERLHRSGLTAADMWCLDSERRNTDGPPGISFRLLQDGAGTPGVSKEQIDEIVGEGARDRGGKGNANVGDGGVAFVLSSSGPSPGGSETLLQLVRGLRAAGIFTAVAVTRPFLFEGPKKRQAADTLTAQLQQCAHLVALIDQEVLAGVQTGEVGSPMTMADATRFADNALEHMVRTLLTALTAPAILESTQGALRWDGLQYEKRYRRLLSPPLQRLLTQPGVAVLGRGGAAMPVQHAVGLGAKDALMQLASEAVRVAAQSPFLERAVGRATAVLCCVYLPDAALPAPGASGPGGRIDTATSRRAVQAAAGALALACPCDKIVMCAVLTPPDQLAQDGAGPSSIDVQASVLVLHDPEAQAITVPSVAPAAASSPRMQAPRRVAARPVLMPNSTWNAMSALAGGTVRPQAVPAQSASAAAAAAPAAPARKRDTDTRRAARPSGDPAQQESVTVGDYLVKSLTAHSLDLPPRAAKWRQLQREGTAGQRPRLIIREAGVAVSEDEAEGEGAGPFDGALRSLLGLPAERAVDVRERTSGILEQDRGELWDSPDS